MNDNKYYMIITNNEDYQIDKSNSFSILGFPDKNMNRVKNFRKGDKIIFYVIKKSLFPAVVEVTGQYFFSKKQIWNDDFDLWPHRISCSPIHVVKNDKNAVNIKEIWDDLHFIKSKTKWGIYVQGSFRNLDEHDYNIIVNKIIERCSI